MDAAFGSNFKSEVSGQRLWGDWDDEQWISTLSQISYIFNFKLSLKNIKGLETRTRALLVDLKVEVKVA